MKKIDISKEETLQFQNILPGVGCFETLELVEKIFNKVVKLESGGRLMLEDDEFSLLFNSINELSKGKALRYQSLTLARKIIKYKENE